MFLVMLSSVLAEYIEIFIDLYTLVLVTILVILNISHDMTLQIISLLTYGRNFEVFHAGNYVGEYYRVSIRTP